MTFKDLIGSGTTGFIGLLNTVVVPVIFAFAFLAFVWGAVNYFFFHGEEETKRTDGKKFLMWGIIGMVLMFSVWGFVNLLLSTLGLGRTS